jgi:mRNA interferase MazF
MTTYQAGELVLIAFPFAAAGQGKVRPALVVLDTGDADVVLARVTSQPHTSAHDVSLVDWQDAGLLGPSFARRHKLATMEKALVRRRLGQLQPADHAKVAAILGQLFSNW